MKKSTKRAAAAVMSISMLLAAVGGAGAVDSKYSSRLEQQEAAGKIYVALNTGRWDNQKIDGYTGNYSVYVPDNFEYCSPAVLLLTPNGTTAKDWLDSELGKRWISVADNNAISLVVAEPESGKWNLQDDSSGRNDQEYLYKIYGKLTNKSQSQQKLEEKIIIFRTRKFRFEYGRSMWQMRHIKTIFLIGCRQIA